MFVFWVLWLCIVLTWVYVCLFYLMCVLMKDALQIKWSFCNSSSFLVRDGKEIAVVYFRNGYMPQNYTSEQVWAPRSGRFGAKRWRVFPPWSCSWISAGLMSVWGSGKQAALPLCWSACSCSVRNVDPDKASSKFPQKCCRRSKNPTEPTLGDQTDKERLQKHLWWGLCCSAGMLASWWSDLEPWNVRTSAPT